MNMKIGIAAILLVALFLVGCEQQQTGYATYNQPGAPQGGQYVGGGCGVAPSEEIGQSPVDSLNAGSSL